MYHRAKTHFKKADPILYKAAQLYKIADIRRSRDVFGDLVHAIVNQQLSGKAADTIYDRLKMKCEAQSAKRKIDEKIENISSTAIEDRDKNRGKEAGKNGKQTREWGKGKSSAVITPEAITKLSPHIMRTCGLSTAKVKSIKSLAKSVVRKEIDLVGIHKYDDDKVVELLTSINGIGPWTAEMVLMFSLGRTDIFSKGDLGLRKGITYLYGLKKLPSEKFMDKLAKAWSPYKT